MNWIWWIWFVEGIVTGVGAWCVVDYTRRAMNERAMIRELKEIRRMAEKGESEDEIEDET